MATRPDLSLLDYERGKWYKLGLNGKNNKVVVTDLWYNVKSSNDTRLSEAHELQIQLNLIDKKELSYINICLSMLEIRHSIRHNISMCVSYILVYMLTYICNHIDHIYKPTIYSYKNP